MGGTGGTTGGGTGGTTGGGTGGTTGGGTGGTGGTGFVEPGGFCDELPALPSAPVIDGALDLGVPDPILVEPVSPWGQIVPAGHSMSYVAAWRPDGVYFFIEIEDPNYNPADEDMAVWQGDGVEIYVDGDGQYPGNGSYDVPGTSHIVVAGPVDASTPSTRNEIYQMTAPQDFAVSQVISVPTADGYVVEAFIVAADLGLTSDLSLTAGGSVGFDLAHNVSVAPGQTGVEGNRQMEYFLRLGPLNEIPYISTTAFCTPTLAEATGGFGGAGGSG